MSYIPGSLLNTINKLKGSSTQNSYIPGSLIDTINKIKTRPVQTSLVPLITRENYASLAPKTQPTTQPEIQPTPPTRSFQLPQEIIPINTGIEKRTSTIAIPPKGFKEDPTNQFLDTALSTLLPTKLIADKPLPQFAQEHPIASAVATGIGEIGNLLLVRQLGGGLGLTGTVEKMAGGLRNIFPTITRAAGYSASTASIFGITKFLETALNQIRDKKLNVSELGTETAKGAFVGSVLGPAGALSNYPLRITGGGIAMGGLDSLETMVQNGQITSDDIAHIAVNTLIGMIFEASGGVRKTKIYRGQELSNFREDQAIARIQSNNPKLNWQEATNVYDTVNTLPKSMFNSLRKSNETRFVQILKEVPESFRTATPSEQNAYIEKVTKLVIEKDLDIPTAIKQAGIIGIPVEQVPVEVPIQTPSVAPTSPVAAVSETTPTITTPVQPIATKPTETVSSLNDKLRVLKQEKSRLETGRQSKSVRNNVVIIDNVIANYESQLKVLKPTQQPKISNNLYHGTSLSLLYNISKNGLTIENEPQQKGVSSPKNISLSANEVVASQYGGNNNIIIRVKRGYNPGDLEPDLFGGEGTYITHKNISPELLEVKENGKWISLTKFIESNKPKTPVTNAVRRIKAQKIKPVVVSPTPKIIQATEKVLPRELTGAKPRYGYKDKQFTLTFKSDVDKALYIVAKEIPSKADAQYLSFLKTVYPNKSSNELRVMGSVVRSNIKELAKDSEPGNLIIEKVKQQTSEKPKFEVKPKTSAEVRVEAQEKKRSIYNINHPQNNPEIIRKNIIDYFNKNKGKQFAEEDSKQMDYNNSLKINGLVPENKIAITHSLDTTDLKFIIENKGNLASRSLAVGGLYWDAGGLIFIGNVDMLKFGSKVGNVWNEDIYAPEIIEKDEAINRYYNFKDLTDLRKNFDLITRYGEARVKSLYIKDFKSVIIEKRALNNLTQEELLYLKNIFGEKNVHILNRIITNKNVNNIINDVILPIQEKIPKLKLTQEEQTDRLNYDKEILEELRQREFIKQGMTVAKGKSAKDEKVYERIIQKTKVQQLPAKEKILNDLIEKIQDKEKLQKNLDKQKNIDDKIIITKGQLSLEQSRKELEKMKAEETTEIIAKRKQHITGRDEFIEWLNLTWNKGGEKEKSQKFFEDLEIDLLDKAMSGKEPEWKSAAVSSFLEENFYEKDRENYFKEKSKPLAEFEQRGEEKFGDFKLYEYSYRLVQKYAKKVSEKYVPRGKAGIAYKSGNIGVKALNNIADVIHEITHVIDEGSKLIENILKNKGINYRVIEALKKSYTETYPKAVKSAKLKVKAKEGFAMFIENMATNPTETKKNYHNLYKEFLLEDGRLHEPILNDLLKDVEIIIKRYQGLDELGKTASKMAGPEIKGKTKSAFSRWDRIQSEAFDYIWMGEKTAKLAGVHFTKNDPSLWLRMYSKIGNIFSTNLSGNKGYWTLDNEGNPKQLYQYNWGNLVALIERDKSSIIYDAYLASRDTYFKYQRVDDLNKLIKNERDGKEVEILEIELDNLESVLKKNNISKEEASGGYLKNKDRFKAYDIIFDNLVRADLELLANPLVRMIDPDLKKKLLTVHGYAPMKHSLLDEFGNNENSYVTFRGKGNRISTMIQRVGSEKPIISPLISAVKVHGEILKKAVKQINYNLSYDIRDVADGKIFQEIPIEYVPMGNRMTLLQAKDPNNIIAIDKNFKKHVLVIDPELKKMYDTAFDSSSIHIFFRLLKGASRLFVKGTTGEFWPFILANIPIDSISVLGQTRENTIPIFDTMRAVYDATINKDPESAQYIKEFFVMGGANQTITRMLDTPDSETALKNINGETNKIMNWINKGADLFAIPSQYSEILNRIGEYINARKNGQHAIVAIEEATRVTASFSHIGRLGGKVGKGVLQGIPFGNVPFQVLHTYIRSAKDPKTMKRVILLTIALTALGVAQTINLIKSLESVKKKGGKDYEAAKKLAEQYINLSPYQLNNYMYYTNGDNMFKMKVPGLYNMYGGMISMMLADKYLNTGYTNREYVDQFLDNNLPNQINFLHPGEAILSYIPQFLKAPTLSMIGYTDFPRLKQIEPDYYKYLKPSERYTPNTNDLAIIIGKEFNVSPMRVELFIKSMFGRTLTSLTDKIKHDQNTYLKSLFEPFKAQVVQKEYLFSGRDFQKFYDAKGKVDQLYKEDKLANREDYGLYGNINDWMSRIRKINNSGVEIPREYQNSINSIVNKINSGDKIGAAKDLDSFISSAGGNFILENIVQLKIGELIQ
jgi:hypothetical protein